MAKHRTLTVGRITQRFLNRLDAAKYLGVSIPFLDRLKANEEIHYYKPSRRLVLFDVRDLERWVLAHKVA